MDPNLYNVIMGNAGVSGHAAIHFRESQPGRKFLSAAADTSQSTDAFGRPLSIDSRPTISTMAGGGTTDPNDAITPVGDARCQADGYLGCTTTWDNTSPNKWTPDNAHQGSYAFVPYLVTGDYYFLEELY